MLARIENFRGIRRGDFQIKGLTLIGADNYAGKSSLAQAVGAALTGRPLPLKGMTKAMAGLLVRSGATKAFVEVATDDNESVVRINWPKAEVSTEGPTPPTATEWAAGLISLAHMDPQERSVALTDFLQAVPSKADLAAELKKAEISEKATEQLWAMITEFGWEESERKARDKGKDYKFQWKNITGENWGSKKGESYVPADWDYELDKEGTNLEQLQADVDNYKSELESAIAASAVDFAEYSRLQELADTEGERHQALDEVAGRLKAAREAEDLANQAVTDNPMPTALPTTVDCPHCAMAVIIRGGKLFKVEDTLSPEKFAEMQTAHMDARNAAATARELSQTIGAEHGAAQSKLTEAKDAQAKVHALDEAAEAEGDKTEVDVEGARASLAAAEARLGSFKKKHDADRIHAAIEKNQLVVDILAPSGLRLNVLYAAVRKFCDEWVKPLIKASGFPSVAIDRELSLTLGDRVYLMLSEAEKYIVRVVLQTAMAMKLGDKVMVIDAADILMRTGRNSLVKMLIKSGIDTLLFMSLASVSELPDLAKSGKGNSYWIEDGEVVERSTATA
ncbi:ATP-binding protein [Pseudomonas sp.]|uniref:AAA family ATPase n=1 Tax=Pseudomonas sp. TaxID=306 RepID=UPI00258DB387|nr:ATP-binding protein [Pseudomonas sp.]